MMRKTCLLLLCLGLLSACDPAPESVAPASRSEPLTPAAEAPAKTTAAEVPAVAVPAAPSSTADKPPAPARQPAPSRPQVAAPSRPAAPAKPESGLVLDLSVPHELFEQALTSETFEELTPILPPLFADEPEPVSPFQISGRLISNERVDDYWESIEGAELQFEFKQ